MDEWGVEGGHYLEVMLDMTETELTAYAEPVVADEVLMDEEESMDGEEKWQKCEEAEVERFIWYKIPASLINARGKVRSMSREEVFRFKNDLE